MLWRMTQDLFLTKKRWKKTFFTSVSSSCIPDVNNSWTKAIHVFIKQWLRSLQMEKVGLCTQFHSISIQRQLKDRIKLNKSCSWGRRVIYANNYKDSWVYTVFLICKQAGPDNYQEEPRRHKYKPLLNGMEYQHTCSTQVQQQEEQAGGKWGKGLT